MPEGERRWRDGSLEEDLPMRSLSEMFNVNYFLVSQTNPHIVPALNLKKRFSRKLGNLVEAEWKHRCVIITIIMIISNHCAIARSGRSPGGTCGRTAFDAAGPLVQLQLSASSAGMSSCSREAV